MLLSPGAEWRKTGQWALTKAPTADYRGKVLDHLARWAHSRGAWVAELESQLDETSGNRHIAIRRLLKILTHAGEDAIGIDLVLVDLPAGEAQALLGKDLSAVAGSTPKVWDTWWTTIGASKQATMLFKTALPGKESLEVTAERKRKISYVKDFVVEGNIGSPEVAEIEVGALLKWRPIVARNREYVTLHFDMKLIELVRPIAVKEKQVGKLKTQIQVPELIEMEKRMSITLPLGGHGAFVVGRAPGSEKGRVTVAFVRAAIGSPRGVPDLPIREREIGAGIRKSGAPK